MVICAVYGCTKRSGRDDVSFFRIPGVRIRPNLKLKELLLSRQKLWLSRLCRSDLNELRIKNARVCSLHFISGAPSLLKDTSNPDWAPSLNLGHSYFENEDREMKRYYKDLDKVTEDCSSSIEEDDSDDEEEEEDQDKVHSHEELSVVNGTVKLDKENGTSHRSNEDGHDRLKYFIFSGQNNSKKTCSVTHDEAFKAAETLLHYMENQENVDHADLILIRGYRKKILENMKLAQ